MRVLRRIVIWEDETFRSSIEFGTSSWDENKESIRHRVDNKKRRRFLPHNSSELSHDMLKLMVEYAMREGKYSNEKIESIIRVGQEVLR